jgi:hypothetical protein
MNAKDENKEIVSVVDLFHKFLGISIVLVYVFLLHLFHGICNPSSVCV